jgi:hypothetical protein
MGLTIPSLRLIIREHKKHPFNGKMLTMGRMDVLATFEQILKLFAEENVVPCELDVTETKTSNIPGCEESGFTSDTVFFGLLGVESLEAMDISDYEGAEYIHDLNMPVPSTLENAFDTILDFGTSEHIFDTKQVLDNYNRMLKVNGRILHMIGASNRIGHGFYQFSPTLYYDYYLANAFSEADGYLVESGKGDPSFKKWKLYKYEYNSYRGLAESFHSAQGVGTFFVAKKGSESTVGVIPQQGQFMGQYTTIASQNKKMAGLAWTSIKNTVPSFAEQPIRGLLRRLRNLRKLQNLRRLQNLRAIYRGYYKKGGLKFLGKI